MTSKRIISGIVALSMIAGMFPASLTAGADNAPITLTPSAPTGQLTITLKIKSTPITPPHRQWRRVQGTA